MQFIIRLLQILGFWTQPFQKRSTAKPLGYMVLFFVWLLLPEIIFIVRQEPTFAIVARNAVECLLIANVILLIGSTIVHQSKLEESYGNMRFALDTIASNVDSKLLSTVTHLGSSTDRYFKVYVGFEGIITLVYALANPVLTLTQYIQSGELPPLHAIIESE